jgi:hypothetical protein
MKKITGHLLVSTFVILLLSGCAANPFFGLGVTKVNTPTLGLTTSIDANGFSKHGEASCSNYLGLVAVGDASLDTAMKNGGITKVHHVDCRYQVILGLYSKFTLVVYGE